MNISLPILEQNNNCIKVVPENSVKKVDTGLSKSTKVPLSKYREQIIKTVSENSVTIIKADTGSGKSTKVPQFLLEAGYEVIVTEPRRLATRAIAERVSEEMDLKLGGLVGYRTAFEWCDSAETKLLFCTDGLQLVYSLTEQYFNGKKRVLVIDEVHEWNINIEVLIAWSKKSISYGCDFKVVIMSATLDVESLSKYFGICTPVIDAPGKLFPIREMRSDIEISIIVKKLVLEGRNVLVFVPGKREIENLIEFLDSCDAVILPLHGELDIKEQKKCFESYTIPKIIVSTNIAQTSITIPDIDAVVDSGKERRIEVRDGVEGLFLSDISRADCIQRKGRAGRTKEGIYILCSSNTIESRPEFSVPEIQRSILDQVVLRLAFVGIDAVQFEFFHQPNIIDLLNAKDVLVNLGALRDNKVTNIGRQMLKMPISCRYARMIVEADRLGVIDDVIVIAAILEVGSLLNRYENIQYLYHTSERTSDLLAELDIWNKVSKMEFIDFKKEGIFPKAYFRTKELVEKLRYSLNGIVKFGSTNDRQSIVLACISGMVDYLYINEYSGYVNGDGKYRQLDKSSCLSFKPNFVVGIPKTIEFKNKWGSVSNMDLISMATKIELEWIIQLAPHFFNIEEGLEPYYSSHYGCCMSITRVTYKGKMITEEAVESSNHPEAKIIKQEWEESRNTINCYSFYNTVAKRQTIIVVDGYSLTVRYEYGDKNPVVYIEENVLFNINSKLLKLDNGTTIDIRCGTYTANNILILKERIERDRISSCWKIIKKSLPKELSIKTSVITEWFRMIKMVEVTHLNNGECVCGYVYLKLMDKKIKLELSNDEEVANLETEESLRFLFGKEIQQNYSEKKFFSRIGGKKIMTAKSKEAKKLFDSFCEEAIKGLNIKNFVDTLKYLDEIFEEILMELS